ncbi:hypothetical protein ACJ72_07759 [Emergomyces africanus]|uniref:Endoplasmic reticulum junction formation protein lunapark n=1 Tax=Emergomyces africanus TaxID=1955775 RepID=A0A1B7NMS9_9EURO|nr:hypothetical protein ACJ72_07759 [Emergomyces africanus]
MVSLWPWKGSSTSPAEFEKTLSTLSAKIARATTLLDRHRQRSRRYRVLWTLYTAFVYILYSTIIILVLGWHNWGPCEYTVVTGGPVVIYLVRLGLDKYYQYRISGTQSHLDELHKQRDATIEKLKEATKYNSTLQLLEKYGGESPRRQGPQTGTASGAATTTAVGTGGRTGIPPPATANIPRMQPGSVPTTPIRSLPVSDQQNTPGPSNLNPNSHQQERQPTEHHIDEPGFAANAFPPSQYKQQHADSHQSHWYDRILDVLLGEDETLPHNRLALICSQCRLVNGQAAPGIRSLEEIGRWRCGSCGALNGEESETRKALAGIQEAETTTSAATTTTNTNTNTNPSRGGSGGGSGQSAGPWDRNMDHHPPSRSSGPGSKTGTEGAWDPLSGRGSGSSEIDEEEDEYYDDGVEDSDENEEGEVEVGVEKVHEIDQDKEGENKKGLRKPGSEADKKRSGNAGREPNSHLRVDDDRTGMAARTRSKSPRKSP